MNVSSGRMFYGIAFLVLSIVVLARITDAGTTLESSTDATSPTTQLDVVVTTTAPGSGSNDTDSDFTTTAAPRNTTVHTGLYTVDYIIIGVTAASVAGSVALVIVVVVSGYKKSKEVKKVYPHDEDRKSIVSGKSSVSNRSGRSKSDRGILND